MTVIRALFLACTLLYFEKTSCGVGVVFAVPQEAKTARYVLHNTGWAIVGTTSVVKEIQGRPFTNVFSFCDGPVDNSTGTPYFYVTHLDRSMQDIFHNPLISMTVSETEYGHCKSKGLDPEDPRCARVTLTGKMVNVTGEEKKFALDSLFTRHPEMASWPLPHLFYPTRLVIDMIWLLDSFGGALFISIEDYYNVHL